MKKIMVMLLILAATTLAMTQTFDPNNRSPNVCLSGGNLVATECPVLTFPAMGSQTNSVYPWMQYPPGVTYNGGIPARTTQCGATVTPRGGGLSDRANIDAAIAACTAGQHVQLSAGVFILRNFDSINATKNNVTIRGVGPGPGGVIPNASGSIPSPACAASTCTIIYNADWLTAITNLLINAGAGDHPDGTPIALASDAHQGDMSVTLASTPSGAQWAVGNLVATSVLTCDPTTFVNNWPNTTNWEVQCGGIRHAVFVDMNPAAATYYGQSARYIQQLSKIASVSGNVVTFETPLANTFAVANGGIVSPFASSVTRGVGIEDIYFYGGTGGAGAIGLHLCDGCWVKHVESHFNLGADVMSYCYKCEYRDSYIHESQQNGNETNGGGGYLSSIDLSAHTLFENNVVWNGEKVIVMRNSGPGNVVAYNYMDDSFDAPPVAQETGVNDSHFTASHFDLIEGNWSHQYSGDSAWGNQIYITVYRNWLTGLRGARGWLSTFLWNVSSNPPGWYYCDCVARTAVALQSFSYWHNIVGNVIGFANQFSTAYNGNVKGGSYVAHQTSMRYESPMDGNTFNDDSNITMYALGQSQNGTYPELATPDPNLYQKINRQGNYDYVTLSQIWYASYGGIGTTSTGPPQRLPNSLYLSSNGASQPAFFASSSYCPCTWPWVNPGTGATYILPAKARFDAGTPNTL